MLSVFFSNTNKFFSKGSQDQYTLSFGKFIIFCLLLCTWSQFATATAKSLQSFRLCATPWTAPYQAPLSMGFSRQEYWSGVPLPAPGGQFR